MVSVRLHRRWRGASRKIGGVAAGARPRRAGIARPRPIPGRRQAAQASSSIDDDHRAASRSGRLAVRADSPVAGDARQDLHQRRSGASSSPIGHELPDGRRATVSSRVDSSMSIICRRTLRLGTSGPVFRSMRSRWPTAVILGQAVSGRLVSDRWRMPGSAGVLGSDELSPPQALAIRVDQIRDQRSRARRRRCGAAAMIAARGLPSAGLPAGAAREPDDEREPRPSQPLADRASCGVAAALEPEVPPRLRASRSRPAAGRGPATESRDDQGAGRPR